MKNLIKKLSAVFACVAVVLVAGATLAACGETSTHVKTFAELKSAVGNGEIVLDQNITFKAENKGDLIVVTKDTTINLNGKKIDLDSSAQEEDLFTVDGATLTLTGNGEITGKDCYIVAVSKTENSKVVIKNGTYKVTDSATAVHTFGGKVVIEGGRYANTPEASTNYGHKYLINVQDDVQDKAAAVTITGGTFENFNPASTTDGNFVPSTHKSTEADGAWTVTKK